MGVQPPAPSLGFMVSEGRQWMEIAPWTVLAPGSAIVFVVASFTFLGQGLDAALARRT
jgi:peptide/nickel transport system permease protein